MSKSIARTTYTGDLVIVKAEQQSFLILLLAEMIGLPQYWLAPMHCPSGILSLVIIPMIREHDTILCSEDPSSNMI